jgi:hypothetical protein
MKNISKIFVVNLNDKQHRWNKFESIEDSRMNRFSAIDSRINHKIYENYDFKFDPVGLPSKFYFSVAPGAIGVYLSFYSIWKSIIDNDIDVALILEDDADVDDVKSYLNLNKQIDTDSYDFIQLGKRCNKPWVKDYTENFDGLESYVLTKRGAEILVNSTNDASHFNDVIKIKPFGAGPYGMGGLDKYKMFANEPKQVWTSTKSIRCAVDKFVGYCANKNHSYDKRLRVKLEPCINLHNQIIVSDILNKDCVDWTKLTEQDLEKFKNSDQYEFWKNK